MAQWKQGDVVRLKSGGPKLTVVAESGMEPGHMICVWFDGSKKLEDVFATHTLELADDSGAMTNAR
jgi:uncharacterized protein YodC (DUF2158 family)